MFSLKRVINSAWVRVVSEILLCPDAHELRSKPWLVVACSLAGNRLATRSGHEWCTLSFPPPDHPAFFVRGVERVRPTRRSP